MPSEYLNPRRHARHARRALNIFERNIRVTGIDFVKGGRHRFL